MELQQGLIEKKRKKALNDQITLNLLEGYNYDWEAVIAHLEEVTGDSTSSYYWHVLLLSIDEQSAEKHLGRKQTENAGVWS